MRFLVDSIVLEDTVCIAQDEDGLLIARSNCGKSMIPIWPDPECFEKTRGDAFPGFNPKSISRTEFEEKFLPDMNEDEFLAMFPNSNLDYEIFTAQEIREAMAFVDHWLNSEH